MRRPLLRELQPPHAPTPHLIGCLSSPELPCGPQCGAARGYVKVLALHSACASGAHARARRAHTVCLYPVYVRLLSIEFGHLSAQNRHIFRSAGLKRALARLRLARFLTRQKGLNHVPLAHPWLTLTADRSSRTILRAPRDSAHPPQAPHVSSHPVPDIPHTAHTERPCGTRDTRFTHGCTRAVGVVSATSRRATRTTRTGVPGSHR